MSSTDTERSEAGTRPAAASFGYHPALDGVRAIAIAMVLMVHASITSPWTWTTGWSSWLGVDVFFVLSGFLITTLLLQEIDRRGKVDLLAFYIRRFLRLYPMILVVVVVSLATMVLLPVADQSRTTGLGTTSIALYFNNWLVIAQGGSGSLGVFGHLWSLAIEEQFYLVWPIVVIVCLKLGSRRLLPFLVAVLGAAGSALHRWASWNQAKAWRVGDATIVERTDHLRAASRYWYHSSFTRVDGLLIGCALAVVVVSLRGPTASRLQAWLHDATGWPVARLHRIIRRTVGALGLLGAVVAELIVYRSHGEVFPELLIGRGLPLFEIAVGLVIVNLVVNRAGVMATVLAWRPLVWIGRRSYAIYVLHPIFIIGASRLIADTQVVRALAVGVTIVVAGLSYRYYEAPILRLKGRFGAGREAPETIAGSATLARATSDGR